MIITPDSKENMESQATIFETIMKRCNCKNHNVKGIVPVVREVKFCSSYCGCINCSNTSDNQSEDTDEEYDTDSDIDADIDDPSNEDMQEITTFQSCNLKYHSFLAILIGFAH